MDNGKLIDFNVEDVYSADGQLRGHVEPPPKLKQFLGQASWYLRDSNWDPDFPTAAQSAEWFFLKETGRQVDGVIAINLFLAQKILEATGPISLPDYNETINSQNLFERAEYYSEINFFPGSTQKKDFLGSLAKTLFINLQNQDTKNTFKSGLAIFESLQQKDVLLSLHDEKANQSLASLNWSGHIQNFPSKENTLNDYLFIVEANVGVNKANFFVTRSTNHQIDISKTGETTETLNLIYQNESPSESWPAGTYQNYLRIYCPYDSLLNSLKINDQEISPTQIDTSLEHQKTVFGFLVKVPIKASTKVTLSYQTPLKFNFQTEVQNFNFLFQKQSGAKPNQAEIKINFPQFLKIIKTSPQASVTPQEVVFQETLDQDKILNINFFSQ